MTLTQWITSSRTTMFSTLKCSFVIQRRPVDAFEVLGISLLLRVNPSKYAATLNSFLQSIDCGDKVVVLGKTSSKRIKY